MIMKAITKNDIRCIVASFDPIKEGTVMEGYAIIDRAAAINNKKEDNSIHLYNAVIHSGTEIHYDNYTAYAKDIIIGNEINDKI